MKASEAAGILTQGLTGELCYHFELRIEAESVLLLRCISLLSALTMLRESHPVKKGDWIVVHAAAGGVGLNLCQASLPC